MINFDSKKNIFYIYLFHLWLIYEIFFLFELRDKNLKHYFLFLKEYLVLLIMDALVDSEY